MDLVLGVDAGGTASRAVLATSDGTVVGRGTAGPGNPVSAGPAAATAIGTAIRQALGPFPATSVAAAVLGVAGVCGPTDHPFAPMCHDLGLTCPPTVVGDVVTAFAAGTPADSGTVLVAGTGAIAARITGHRVTATADGLGWLLGDEGSGRWIGLQTVRAAVRDWSGPLGRLVAARSGATTAEQAVRWAQSLPLTEIGALTRPVCAAARDGAPDAARIIVAAVRHLIATLDELAAPGPVVLAGSLLVADTPVRDGVLGVLEKRKVPTGTARDPAAAAAWLAARQINRHPPEPLHRALLGTHPIIS
ncbi:BadF/BadG/BcrA/BcrD ATPase family protein [Actinoplanes sp. NPDC051411]|uniref:N-acetylglucosamine kinase n=1 Tax=Actinoplanes sp. NPDC051411 TaxID=3155522 RepID=UPI00342A9852